MPCRHRRAALVVVDGVREDPPACLRVALVLSGETVVLGLAAVCIRGHTHVARAFFCVCGLEIQSSARACVAYDIPGFVSRNIEEVGQVKKEEGGRVGGERKKRMKRNDIGEHEECCA